MSKSQILPNPLYSWIMLNQVRFRARHYSWCGSPPERMIGYIWTRERFDKRHCVKRSPEFFRSPSPCSVQFFRFQKLDGWWHVKDTRSFPRRHVALASILAQQEAHDRPLAGQVAISHTAAALLSLADLRIGGHDIFVPGVARELARCAWTWGKNFCSGRQRLCCFAAASAFAQTCKSALQCARIAGLWQTVLPGSTDLVATTLQHAALYKMFLWSLWEGLDWVKSRTMLTKHNSRWRLRTEDTYNICTYILYIYTYDYMCISNIYTL